MIYCKLQETKFRNMIEFKAKTYFNSDGDKVSSLLSGDTIVILPLVAGGDSKVAVIDHVDRDGWIIPVHIKIPNFFEG